MLSLFYELWIFIFEKQAAPQQVPLRPIAVELGQRGAQLRRNPLVLEAFEQLGMPSSVGKIPY